MDSLQAGTLLYAPEMAYERLDWLDRRIADIQARRDRAQRALDGVIAQAEALLAER